MKNRVSEIVGSLSGKRFYFIGVGGIGMSGLARIVKHHGATVSGSDYMSSDITDELIREGIAVSIGHVNDPRDIDVAVYSSAISEDNHEYKWFLAQGVVLVPRGMLLAELMNSGMSIGVTGTHGKTTTSSLLSFLTHEIGMDPTAIVGGYMQDYGSNILCGAGHLYVAEVDESDKTQRYYTPDITVITNLEEDHLDNYAGMTDLVDSFVQYIDALAETAVIVYNRDDDAVHELVSAKSVQTLSFGLSDDAQYQARNIQGEAAGTRFELWKEGAFVTDVVISLLGVHNVLNALAACAVVERCGRTVFDILQPLSRFSGVQRRMDILFESRDLVVIDDYAHHPTEIKHVLRTLKQQGRRVLAIFQPHRYSRTKHLLQEFRDAFNDADRLILTHIYSAGETPIDGVDIYGMYDAVSAVYPQACDVVAMEDIPRIIDQEKQPGDIVAFLGAGDITAVAHGYAQRLQHGAVQKVAQKS